MVVNTGLHDVITFRLPTPMAATLRRRALVEKVDSSTLIRVWLLKHLLSAASTG